MRRKLGEILIERGLITPAQLSKALTSQLIFGGHTGTCLLDLGMIDEDSLGEALALSANVSYAPFATLANIPADVIRILPRRMAERYHAIPIKRVDDRLHVALSNPRNLHAIDDMSFASGYKVTPWIAPEVRILQALEKYYGRPRRLRYIQLCRTLEMAIERKVAALSNESRAQDGKPLMDMESCCGLPNLGGEFGYGRTWREIAVELNLSPGVPTKAVHKGTGQQQPTLAPADDIYPTLWETTQRLTRAEDKQQAVSALLDYTSARMERSIFLGVDEEVAHVWDTRGQSFDRRRRSTVSFDIRTERLFELMLGSEVFRGPLPAFSAFRDFYRALGMPFPGDILMLPVHVNDHLVAIFYGDGGEHGSILGETDDYVRLIRVFSTSVELLLLKERMQMIGGKSIPSIETPDQLGVSQQATAKRENGDQEQVPVLSTRTKRDSGDRG